MNVFEYSSQIIMHYLISMLTKLTTKSVPFISSSD